MIRDMTEDRFYHRIADEIESGWLDAWAAAGVAELEAYLAKHAAFQGFLDGELV
jgi:hypothetical protein